MNKSRSDLLKENMILRDVIRDTLWMAVRYAHGRNTYAPQMIRDAYAKLLKVAPELKLKKDITLEETPVCGLKLKSDDLHELYFLEPNFKKEV